MMGRLFRGLAQADTALASLALVLMALIPLVEILSRPLMGKGIENAPVVVQHLGLLMAMAGAIAAERFGHLTSLGVVVPRFYALGQIGAAAVCGVLAWASGHLVMSEIGAEQVLAYVYALLHGPGYSSAYAEFLKSDFPRIPIACLPESGHPFAALWKALLPLGQTLIDAHLLRKVPAFRWRVITW
jgi:hypothetical protein